MNFHEFGEGNGEVIVLVHPSMVSWDYYLDVIPLLEKEYHLVVPSLPGTDMTNDSEFTSVEACASEIADYLLGKGIESIKAIHGCSLGGSIVLRMAADERLNVRHYLIDAGITPYQLPRFLTIFIALRDFCMVSMGKIGGEKLMLKAFSSSQYGEDELKYMATLMKHTTFKTIWRSFDSCNNYNMPKEPMRFSGTMHYWYGEKERKARDWDIRYMKKFVPATLFREFEGMDHADLVLYHADLFAQEIRHLDADKGMTR